MPDNVWDFLHEALKEVVKNGTGYGCYMKELEIAGKTGTAQNPHGQDYAWFLSFAPAESPELALAVLVENGGSGGAVAVPVAREIYSAAFGIETAGPLKGRKTQQPEVIPGAEKPSIESCSPAPNRRDSATTWSESDGVVAKEVAVVLEAQVVLTRMASSAPSNGLLRKSSAPSRSAPRRDSRPCCR